MGVVPSHEMLAEGPFHASGLEGCSNLLLVPMTSEYFPSPHCTLFQQFFSVRSSASVRYTSRFAEDGIDLRPDAVPQLSDTAEGLYAKYVDSFRAFKTNMEFQAQVDALVTGDGASTSSAMSALRCADLPGDGSSGQSAFSSGPLAEDLLELTCRPSERVVPQDARSTPRHHLPWPVPCTVAFRPNFSKRSGPVDDYITLRGHMLRVIGYVGIVPVHRATPSSGEDCPGVPAEWEMDGARDNASEEDAELVVFMSRTVGDRKAMSALHLAAKTYFKQCLMLSGYPCSPLPNLILRGLRTHVPMLCAMRELRKHVLSRAELDDGRLPACAINTHDKVRTDKITVHGSYFRWCLSSGMVSLLCTTLAQLTALTATKNTKAPTTGVVGCDDTAKEVDTPPVGPQRGSPRSDMPARSPSLSVSPTSHVTPYDGRIWMEESAEGPRAAALAGETEVAASDFCTAGLQVVGATLSSKNGDGERVVGSGALLPQSRQGETTSLWSASSGNFQPAGALLHGDGVPARPEDCGDTSSLLATIGEEPLTEREVTAWLTWHSLQPCDDAPGTPSLPSKQLSFLLEAMLGERFASDGASPESDASQGALIHSAPLPHSSAGPNEQSHEAPDEEFRMEDWLVASIGNECIRARNASEDDDHWVRLPGENGCKGKLYEDEMLHIWRFRMAGEVFYYATYPLFTRSRPAKASNGSGTPEVTPTSKAARPAGNSQGVRQLPPRNPLTAHVTTPPQQYSVPGDGCSTASASPEPQVSPQKFVSPTRAAQRCGPPPGVQRPHQQQPNVSVYSNSHLHFQPSQHVAHHQHQLPQPPLPPFHCDPASQQRAPPPGPHLYRPPHCTNSLRDLSTTTDSWMLPAEVHRHTNASTPTLVSPPGYTQHLLDIRSRGLEGGEIPVAITPHQLPFHQPFFAFPPQSTGALPQDTSGLEHHTMFPRHHVPMPTPVDANTAYMLFQTNPFFL